MTQQFSSPEMGPQTGSPTRKAETYRDLLQATLFGSDQSANASQVAVSSGSGSVTRAQLAERVATQTQLFCTQQAGPETLIGLKLSPSIESVIAILSVLNAGAGYLPLDPQHSELRNNQILKTVKPDLLITREGGFDLREGIDLTDSSYGANSLAYVISTSGSTGSPKAPVLEQSGLVNHTLAMIEFLDLGPSDVVLQTAPPSFDIAVWQYTTPIIAGSRLHIANHDQRFSPRDLWQVLVDEQVTTVQVVPSMLRLMIDCAPARTELALRNVISTGEALPPDLANRWLELYGDLPLINIYGPAECSDDVTVHVVDRPTDPLRPVPIGTAFAGAILSVVDQNGNPVEPGTAGELIVSGPPVGRGYRNAPELTAVAFTQELVGGRLVRSYKTGDLVICDDKGVLSFVGRKDHQVKVRGNRVELGEIESVLGLRRDIAAAVVEKLDDGTDRLAAHIELSPTTSAEFADRQLWQDHVAERLPGYMVPTAFVTYEKLPLNQNGKLDRKALRRPDLADLPGGAQEFRAATTEVEIIMASVWAETLGLEEVGVDSDFFDLGGTSLLAVLCIESLRKMGFSLGVGDLADNRTVSQLARKLTQQTCSVEGDSDQPGAVRVVTLSRGSLGINSRPPLFLCPGEASPALGFVELSRNLEHGGPVHVLTADRSIERDPEHLSMQELAGRAIAAMRRVQPNGPYFLGGFCGGGDLAWEIASQLEVDGAGPLSVLLLQTEREAAYPAYEAGVSGLTRAVANFGQRVAFETETLKNLSSVQRRAHTRHLVFGKVGARLTVPIESAVHRLGLPAALKPKRSIRYAQSLWAKADQAAYEGWTPGIIKAPVTVFYASRQPPYAKPDPSLGWSDLGLDQLSAVEVDAFHMNFLHLPAVVHLAQAMRVAMESDLARYSSEGPPDSTSTQLISNS